MIGERQSHGIQALLYPERILSVSGLSVPHSFLGSDIKPTEMLKELYKKNFFYILYFQEEGVAEKEFEKEYEKLSKANFFKFRLSGNAKKYRNND